MKKLAAISVALMALAPAPASFATVITFEEAGLTAMSNSPGAAVPAGSQLSTFFLTSLGVSFSSGAGFAAVVNHVPGCPTCTPTPPNVIGGTAAGGTLNYGVPISAALFLPGGGATAAVTGSVSVASDLVPVGGTITLEGYDVFGALIASTTLADGFVLSLAAPGIHSVRFFSQSATVGFDNFTFGDLTAAVAAGVPEPATSTLMLSGLGAVGFAIRRKRRAPRATA